MENSTRSLDSMQADLTQTERKDCDKALGDMRDLSLDELSRISGGTASVSFL